MRVQIFTQLQTIDQQLSRMAHERDQLLVQLGEREIMRTLTGLRRDQMRVVREEQAHNSDLQWELEDVELRLHALHEQEHDGPSDPLVARELVLLRERRVQLEELVLRQLEQIAELEQQLALVERELEAARSVWAEREPQLKAAIDQLGHDLEAMQIERQRIAARLPAAAIELYDDLQRRHRGTALAPIRNRQCSACRARLPAAVFDMLNTSDPLVRCPRCGRVLFVPEQE